MKRDIYSYITNLICEKLENGVNPFVMPFVEKGISFPTSLISQKRYRGANVLILALANYENNYFLTFKQAKDLGAKIKKGAKSLPVIYFQKQKFATKDKETNEEIIKEIPLLKYYNVFNISQVENLPEKILKNIENKPNLTISKIDKCEEIIRNYKNQPTIEFTHNEAAYNPVKDVILMPEKTQFLDEFHLYSTLFHEVAHSTGHKKRLDRDLLNFDNYAFEELIAEITNAFLCRHANIEKKTIDNSVAYLKGWASKLRDNEKWLIRASAKAQKAYNYILNNEED